MMRRLGVTALGLRNGPHRVTVERDLAVPAADGVELLADRYAPVDVDKAPTVLVRSPYGRRGPFGLMCGQAFASHGFQAVVQSVRGGFGSGGVFEALDEREDGLATIEWLKSQPWFGGTFAMHGPSYLGYVQWAVAAEAGPELKALSMQVTASTFRDAVNVGGTFALESALIWVDLTARMKNSLSGITTGIMSPRRARRATLSGRPLEELDRLATGAQQRFFQELLVNGPDTPFWDKRDFSPAVSEVTAPVNMTGGWYDIFLPWQMKDYAALRAAGRRPYLTIGPWFHADQRMMRGSVADSVAWFRAHLLDDPSDLREQPVRLYITGADEWREFPDWPVPGMREERWHLHPAGALSPDAPPESDPDTYRYDPNHPTPFLGGPTLLGETRPSTDQKRLERRRDVLAYTSAVLDEDVEIIGPVTADLHIRSDRDHTDFVVRLCDVTPDGESLNLCEGMRRLVPGTPPADADGIRHVAVELWPAGHRFRAGHRIRVQVASGAYPRVARNPGTGAPIGTATEMLTADQEIFHDPTHPSTINLPVVRLTDAEGLE
ncbi:CocE/NonD family hydrolase [Actinomadura sp. BRA 177]|uniref:CocE/NonD family hydrolase n=1 Tax=Actinomadura sp. BRA 177 TaxID=2745202 RepID=UPI001595AF7B|nr:CocE/NonD family hydrolase [Actinomadura sp. BRA 177]NVI86969.1 CocE/NonD family hydrolase [Actinomadura sp. BRA 177]